MILLAISAGCLAYVASRLGNRPVGTSLIVGLVVFAVALAVVVVPT